jgi:hypothetical protein
MPEPTTNDVEIAPADFAESDVGDPYLSALVRTANAGALTANVTLWVAGAVLSGHLIGAGEYFETLAAVLEAAGADAEISEGYREQADYFREIGGDDVGQAMEADYTVTYIHLRDLRDWSIIGFPVKGVLWRGRIDKIDGWSLASVK